jgi:hypothetical protein
MGLSLATHDNRCERISWGHLRIRPPVDVVYKVTDKTLELTAPGKKTQRLIRVVPTWYHALTESEAEEAKIRLQKMLKENKQ